MNIPEELRYTKEHEWARPEGELVRVGITDFAQDSLGDVVYVELPEPGATVEADSPCGEVESTKSVSELYAPLSGSVVEVNGELDASPNLVNDDPYGDGWIYVVRPSDPDAVNRLLDAAAYSELVSD